MAKSRSLSLGQVSDLDIRLLRISKTIIECSSFSAAESTLGLSHLAISLHMGDLEECLGICPCQRGRAGFVLTDEGREVYRSTQTLLAALEGFHAEVNDLHQHLRGKLNIDIINNLVTLLQMRITHALSALKGQGPQVRVSISMITPNEIELGALDGHLHAGVVPLISLLSGLEYLPLYDEHVQFYRGRGHALLERADDDIAVDEVFAADAVAPSYRLPTEAQAHHQELNNSASASDREGMAFLILTGNFIGYLPSHCAADWVVAGMLRPLLLEYFHYAIAPTIVTRKGRRPNLVLERFLEAMAVS